MRALPRKIILYVIVSLFGFIMIYPLLWVFSASFKSNAEIFTTIGLIPQHFSFDAFVQGWKGTGQVTFGTYLQNSFLLVVPTVLFTIVSSVLVGYGFARFRFPFKKILFMLMISTLMLPAASVIIPRYIIFNRLGWLNTYLPFYVPALFGCYPFFIFLMVQFFRGLPKELEESAYIDGCNSFGVLVKILLPLCKPAIISTLIFQFIWTWNDFFNSLVYINSVTKYTLMLGLNTFIDASSKINWNQVMAMSVIAMIPSIILFFTCQRYFVEGIATTGLKG